MGQSIRTREDAMALAGSFSKKEFSKQLHLATAIVGDVRSPRAISETFTWSEWLEVLEEIDGRQMRLVR